ncbi:restriction endonuclease subunit S [Acidithiobacillus sp. MC6.1]|nr:restriction endonuclease subunit S [Acidithiobacillus sp. MC6.1]
MSSEKEHGAAVTEKQKGLVPKLRFPEFRNTGEWEVAKLGDISTVVRGGSPRPIEGFITMAAGGLNWLKIGDVDIEAKYVTKTQQKVRPEALSKTREVYPGDLILSNSMSFGRPYIMRIKSCIHDGWIALTKIDKRVSREYLYYAIFAPKSQCYFLDYAAGSGVLNLNAEIIKDLTIPKPCLEEQQKIADCLSSLDDLITAEAKKLDALKVHKKGLMQQLFPREGETVPRLRFPEFRDAGEWEEKKLGDVAVFYKGKGLPKSVITPKGKNLCIHYGELFTEYPEVIKTVKRRTNLDENTFMSNENDVLMPTSDVTPSGLAKACCIKSAGVILGGDILIIRANKQEIDGEFLARHIRHLEQKVLQLVSGSTVFHLYAASIEKLALSFPLSLEQQKIADCLSSLDDLITAQTQKLDALKTHKNPKFRD